MLLLKFLLAAFLFLHEVAAQCGPAQCYNGCTDARPQVDFVFLIDTSGSMQPKIDGVKKGLTTFAQNLDGNKISPKFAIVNFGQTTPSLRQQLTDFGTFKTSMDGLSTSGGREPGLEALSNALSIAASGNLGISYRTGSNSKKVFILVTNEDSDKAYRSANLFGTTVGSTTYSQGSANLDGSCFVPSGSSPNINQLTWDYAWQKEIDFVANSLISNDASVYMFVGWTKSLSTNDVDLSQTCNTPYQYCNPDLQTQAANYSNFNSATTLTTLTNQSPRQDRSLQGRLLTAGKTARCFDVADTSNSDLVNNFFSEIVSDVSQCNKCYSYPCVSSACQTPVYICDCAGTVNGPKVKDANGNCCLPSEKDCAGICNGNSKYDTCGVCTANGALYSACKPDCNGTYYLDLPANPTSLTSYSSLIYTTTCPDVAGYLIPNADIITLYKSGGSAAVCQHYHQYGRFEGRTQCTMDTARYASDYAVSDSSAKSDYLTRLTTSSPRTAYCKAGTSFKVPNTRDNCGQCVTILDSPPNCIKDCSGAWRSSNASLYYIDNCGYCVSPSTNPNARKDDCGVCDGGNALKNECGVCNGTKGINGCNFPVCWTNQTCTKECDGVFRNVTTMAVDVCGFCYNKTAYGARDPRCVQDCSGTYYQNLNATSSPHIVDECGNCVPRSQVRLPTCVQDCNKVWNGNAYLDACNQCVVNNNPTYPCKQDCQLNYYLEGKTPVNYTIDDCGNCRPNATRNDMKDLCGICTNTPNYNSATQCTPDCKGIYRLSTSSDRAFTDLCGKCWFANETAKTNINMDACGYCWELDDTAHWNKTNTVTDSQGFPCLCGQTPTPCTNASVTTCNDNCPETNLCPNSNQPYDFCGRCPSSSYYNKPRDDCGICCDPDNGVPCNQDKDDCGVCFGFNKDKTNPCGICLNIAGNTCVPDCLGVYGGNATYGCDGVCNSKATCSFCGNGIIEAGETCDLGPNAQNVSQNVAGSGCSPNCVAEAGNNTGSIIGGVIGGIAAIAFLGLAAFLAVKYAQKAGLIGNANKQVDFGASNQNPLYKTQVQTHSNPLYESH